MRTIQLPSVLCNENDRLSMILRDVHFKFSTNKHFPINPKFIRQNMCSTNYHSNTLYEVQHTINDWNLNQFPLNIVQGKFQPFVLLDFVQGVAVVISRTHNCLNPFGIQQQLMFLYKTYICPPFPNSFKKQLFYYIPQQVPIRNPTKQVATISPIVISTR